MNLTSTGTWRAPIHELIPVGPLKVRVRLPKEVRASSARLLVSGTSQTPAVREGWATLEVWSVLDHEVVVIA